jgi:hypothetical protein
MSVNHSVDLTKLGVPLLGPSDKHTAMTLASAMQIKKKLDSFIFSSPTALAEFVLGPRASHHSSISNLDVERQGHRALYHTSAGNLDMLRMAEVLVVSIDADDIHLTSVEQLLGLIICLVKVAWRKQPL